MKVSFIGGGNMGEAILAALINNKLATAADISVADAKTERRDYLKQKYGVFTTDSNLEAASRGDTIILAVKPQNLDEVAAEMAGKLKKGQLILTIIAGKKTSAITQGFKHKAVVRAMPNTPAQIGQGMSVWTATDAVTEAQREAARAILGVMGKAVYTPREEVLDMATAISGSGPAYVFSFMEALIKAGGDIGMPAELARTLVFQTLLGSAEYARQSGKDLDELRRNVTSPGGTTAAALKVFEEGGFDPLVAKAVAAAFKRARELGG